MTVAIAAGVGVFLAAQDQKLVPNAWSEEPIASYATYRQGTDAGPHDAAIAAHPDDFMVYYRRGLHYQAQGKLHLALADLDRAVALSPAPVPRAMLAERAQDSLSPEARTLNRVVFVRLVRANVLSQLDRNVEALADLDNVIALDDRKFSAIFARAALLTSLGRYDAAIADYNTLLDRRPDSGWSFGRGVAQFKKGDFAAAVADLGEAVRREPQDSEFQRWFEKASQRADLQDD